MVVTVLVVRVMQVFVDDIVDMVAVRNGVMSTRSAVDMARVVSGARMERRAASRICFTRAENVTAAGPVLMIVHRSLPLSFCEGRAPEHVADRRHFRKNAT